MQLGLRVFDLEELSSATNGFSRVLKVGEGGFGSVYLAFFRSAGGGRVVLAVKRLNQRSLQGHKQCLAEVQFLGVLEHQNLVKLIGYCAVDSEASRQRLLVYEFMPNKSLDDASGDDLKNWDADFVKVDQATLFDLILILK